MIGVLFAIIESILFIFILSKFKNSKVNYRYLDIFIIICVSIITTIFIKFGFTPYIRLILISIILIIITFIYDIKFYKRILAVILFYFILIISDLVVSFLLSNILNITIEDLLSKYYTFFGLISKFLSFLIYAFINRKFLNRKIILPNTLNYLMIVILSLATISMVLLFYSSLSIINESTIFILFLICLFNLFIGLSAIYMYFKANNFYINLQKETTKRIYDKSNEKFIKNFERRNEVLSKIWHDLRNHIKIIEKMSNEQKGAHLEYIDSLKDKLKSIPNPINTGNNLINIVLNDKYTEANVQGIDFDIKAVAPPNLNIDDIDLSSILFNTLDNAIEACINCNESNKYINLELYPEGYFLYYRIVNSYNPAKNYSNKFIYNKKEYLSSGYGLSIIEDIVDKYNGYMDINYDNTEYSLTIILNLSEHEV
ncbi:sensor histidine kinase [Schnuerera sp.]|uniref:sensor histidine kinase n=1 Tax=Schnuerera sp. TaxID=2794844 RepID=UPI002BAC02A9|nr:GHKL domain-containing protein [Schnuerera sp.]HSH35164.1 GHKL domain-containing protein [Schnuerera sp.]